MLARLLRPGQRAASTLERRRELCANASRSRATRRSTCLAFIVASPRLLESHARTVEQMRLINALCRFAEMVEEQSDVHDSAH